MATVPLLTASSLPSKHAAVNTAGEDGLKSTVPPTTMDKDEADYLWKHFAFNAEQRLKAFNFFVVFSVFANGGVFAAADKNSHPITFVLIGGFVCILSAVFWTIDARSRLLINMAKPGLEKYKRRGEHSQLFTLDRKRGDKNWIRYTTLSVRSSSFSCCSASVPAAYGLCT